MVIARGTMEEKVYNMLLDKNAQGVRQTILEAVHFVPLKSGVA